MITKLTVLPACTAKTSASVTQPQKIAIHFCVLQFYLRFGSSAGFHLHLVVGPDSRAVSASPFNDARHHVLGLDIRRLNGLFYQPFPEQRPLFPNSQSPIGTQVSRKTQRKHPVVWRLDTTRRIREFEVRPNHPRAASRRGIQKATVAEVW